MSLSSSSLSTWRGLAPHEAARRFGEAVAALPSGQQRAILAFRREEEALTRAFAEAADGPLRGVPALAKDLYPWKGYANQAGSLFLAEERGPAERDSALLAAWQAQGGVLAGMTHLHEFAYGITGENPHYGAVTHPRDPRRTSGGSSSGSAAAVAAGLVPLAFGTDTAGSLRVPAAYCGVWSVRFVPQEPWIADVFPLAPSFDTAGWLTTDGASMAESLRVLRPEVAEVSTPRLGWLDLPGVEEDLRTPQREAAFAAGASPLPHALAERLRDAWASAPRLFRALRAPEAWRVHAGWFARRRDAYDPKVRQRLEDGQAVTTAEQAEAQQGQAALQALFSEVWSVCDALATPCTPTVALLHEHCTQAERDRIFLLTTAVSVAGLPSLAVPVALPGGLSTGLQVVVPAHATGRFGPLLSRFVN